MRLVCISDTHKQMDRIDPPEGDLLIHAGDFCGCGKESEVETFNNHLSTIKTRYTYGIVVIAGNHDRYMERKPQKGKLLLSNAQYLCEETIKINNLILYGSPYSPEFCNWAFSYTRGEEAKNRWNNIPRDVNVVITHGPPLWIGDLTQDMQSVGCEELRSRVLSIHPFLHVFGHIHHSYGKFHYEGITFVNAAICDESYLPVNKPIVIDINPAFISSPEI